MLGLADVATDEGKSEMAFSDQLSQLAARTKELEDPPPPPSRRGPTSSRTSRAPRSAQAQAESLRTQAEERKGKLSAWWDNLQR